MKYLEEPKLSMLTSYLCGCKLGDIILDGRIEAFSCKRAGADKKLSKMLEQQYVEEVATSPASLGTSPLGSLADASTRKLLIDLISTMNASFPDYDFSDLRPEHFHKEWNLNMAVNSVNTNLSEIIDTRETGFLEELWGSIESVIETRNCEVYSYLPDMDADDPFTDGSLWSFNYFFFNKQQKKLLYFTCMAKSKLGILEEDAEAMDSDEDDAMDAEDQAEPEFYELDDWDQ